MKKYILTIIVIAFALSLFGNTIYVPHDYSTIQAAVNAAVNGDEIIVDNGTYIEEVNFLDKSINLFSRYYFSHNESDIENTIIESGSHNYDALTINGEHQTKVMGFTIRNSKAAMHMFRPQDTNTTEIISCHFIGNNYGIYYINGSMGTLSIEKCEFKQNSSLACYFYGFSNSNISNSKFWNNNDVILLYGTNPMTNVRSPFHCNITNSTFSNNGGNCIMLDFADATISSSEFHHNDIVFKEHYYGNSFPSHLNISSTTIAENYKAFDNFHPNNTGSSNALIIKNSISWGNTIASTLHSSFDITYCDIEGGFTGTGNIDKDPVFCMDNNYKYHLEEASPCIDTGDPNTSGGDIRIDMGCYETTTDIKALQGSSHWNWISFPRLTRNNNDPVNAPNLLDEMIPSFSELTMKGQDVYDLTYNNVNGWSNPNYTVQSSKGYKLQLNDTGDFILPEEGTRLNNNYVISLSGGGNGENWVGYWLPGSMDWDLALGQYKDRFTQIKAENWTMTKVNGTWWGPSNASFTYGKGYIMYVDTNAYPNGFDFHWAYLGQGGMAFKKATPENFTYEEKPDYEVIDIESIEGGEDIEEIGAYVNGVCVGASKVEEYPVQILAYTEDANKGGDDNTLYFEVVSGKGTAKKINDILEYNAKTGKYEKTTLNAGLSTYHLIKLGDDGYTEHPVNVELSLGNYPNPFNPTTTISYGIAQDGKTKLQIFNLKGQLVKTLIEGIVKKGKYNAVWNGKDNNGKKVTSGIYMYKLTTKEKSITKKMLMLK